MIENINDMQAKTGQIIEVTPYTMVGDTKIPGKTAKVEITELKTNYERLKLAKAYGWDEKSKREANNRITKLVRDIDKCLGLLNEID